MAKKKVGSKKESQKITSEMLSKHASALTSVLYRLRKDYPDLTTDDLWSAIREHWDVQTFQHAIRHAKQNLRPFKSLIKLATKELPRADKDGFFYVRDKKFGTVLAHARARKISHRAISKRVRKCKSILGRCNAGMIFQFYSEADINRCCKDLLSAKPTADSTGFFMHRRTKWGTINAYARLFGVSQRSIVARIKTLRKMPGKVYGKNRDFYKMTDVLRACRDLTTSPKSGRDGFFQSSGQKWGNASAISEELSISQSLAIPILKKHCRSKKGICLNGSVEPHYSLRDAKRVLAPYLRLNRSNNDGFIIRAEKKLATVKKLEQLLGINEITILRRCKKCKKYKGRDRSGRIATFLAVDDVKNACRDLLSSPKVDSTGFFIKRGRKWGHIPILSKTLGLHKTTIHKCAKLCKSLLVKDVKNHPLPCYELAEIQQAYDRLCQSKAVKRKHPITSADLMRYASTLSRVLYELRQKHPSLTSDQLWKKITKQWSSKQLASAVAEYRKTKRVTRFRSLLES